MVTFRRSCPAGPTGLYHPSVRSAFVCCLREVVIWCGLWLSGPWAEPAGPVLRGVHAANVPALDPDDLGLHCGERDADWLNLFLEDRVRGCVRVVLVCGVEGLMQRDEQRYITV